MSPPSLFERQAVHGLWLPALGFVFASIAALDRSFAPAAWLVVGLGVATWILGRARGGPAAAVLLAAGCLLCVAVLFRQLFGADSLSYFVYARSMLFDGDLDFANEHASWGLGDARRTETGLVFNAQSVGPAIVWAPFVLGAHGYVRFTHWLGGPLGAPDGLGGPYLRATLIGTATLAVLGTLWLGRALSRRFTRIEVACAMAAAALGSPVPYYVVISPAMAHGLEYGVACIFLAVWLENERAPGLRPWLVLGALWGLLTLLRWQAALFGVFLVAFALARPQEGRARLVRGLAAAGTAALVFVPQMLAWHSLYGKWLTMPQGPRFMDWSSPRFLSVLVSTDRGFLNWHPVMLAGAIGLVLLLLNPGLRWLAAAGGSVLVATAWVNGSVADWTASDAFGGRRFCLVVPILAVGVAELTRRVVSLTARRPWLVPAGLVGLAVAWNAGLMSLYRKRAIENAPAPVARLAALQTRQLQQALEAAALRLGGPELRNLVYEALVGEYFYENVNPSGIINVGRPDSPYLESGWSRARQRIDWPNFRWAFFPRACVSFALRAPFPLPTTLSARAPDGLEDQFLTVMVNERPVAAQPLANEWTDIRFLIPEPALEPGPNRLCLVFRTALPDSDAGPVAAAVSVIQLP
jgi:hypothetical protein